MTNTPVDRLEDIVVQQSKPQPNLGDFRSPIISFFEHVDTGKTKLLDYIRKTHVQDNEAGGITQQIGATFVPPFSVREQAKYVKVKNEVRVPGLLIIDPSHESFTNLRGRGSSLGDIAILVIDIMHGIEKQTIESINLLKQRNTPFIVALNKIDRLYEWKTNTQKDIEDNINGQTKNTKVEFNKRVKEVIGQLAEQSINGSLFWENPHKYVSLVPTSALTGEGMGNLLNLIVGLSQTMLAERIEYVAGSPDARIINKTDHPNYPGLMTTIDVFLINGSLKDGDKIVMAGHDGAIGTNVQALITSQETGQFPTARMPVIYGPMAVRIVAHDLEKAIAGLRMYVSPNAEVKLLKEMCMANFRHAMEAIKCKPEGVYVQASTPGSLEALLEFLKEAEIPYVGVGLGPVTEKVIKIVVEKMVNSLTKAVIFAFDTDVESYAKSLADSLSIQIYDSKSYLSKFYQTKARQ